MGPDCPRDSGPRHSAGACPDERRRPAGATSYLDLPDWLDWLLQAAMADYLERVDWQQHLLQVPGMPDYLRLQQDDC